ncbi:hypothetical protein ILUMI_25237 [Ignelater luminosus]|uniref:Uncharacterized protein n=1 Tax=Ignelater luminosus TaxID=2038154 RepID=A0A8K0CC26_IGNLU|nr:hypothetical protein ILUMI_25237 [Ignelater luminosus]
MAIYNIPTLLKTVLPNASASSNIIGGFQSTGIWTFNKDIFSKKDFMPSEVTDRQFNGSDVSKVDSQNGVNIVTETIPNHEIYSEPEIVVNSNDEPSSSKTVIQAEAVEKLTRLRTRVFLRRLKNEDNKLIAEE